MIAQKLSFRLPKPWTDQQFEIERFGPINFFVGPNGSGKSRFAEALKSSLPKARLLGTDRLRGLDNFAGLSHFLGDPFALGFAKNQFRQFKNSANDGLALDTIVILEERPDIRIKVEATLSSLFNRRISLEWDSGNLIPRATLGSSGESYRLDREECHGIKELLILLTHLYNDQHEYLIIDEPELNLHPQYQAFFMQEVRRVTGLPTGRPARKVVFLITHSPFILDLKTMDDLLSIMSFKLDHSVPVSLASLDSAISQRLLSLIPRPNVYHKQLFFSDDPVFVEGAFDAQFIEAMQERRGVSITAAGSCIIEVGGKEEVTRYIQLCEALGKKSFFLYDLDSLFFGSLRRSIKSDGGLSDLLASLGVKPDFASYCGELDRVLTEAIRTVRAAEELREPVRQLRAFIDELAGGGELRDASLAKARVAVLVAISAWRDAMVVLLSPKTVGEIQGRLKQIVNVLRTKNVLLLTGGALENYFPTYQGDPFKIPDDAKRAAVEKEIELLAGGSLDSVLADRYRDLFESISLMPAKPPINLDKVLAGYLSNFVHELQGLIVSYEDWGGEQFTQHFAAASGGLGTLFSITAFSRGEGKAFTATIRIKGDPRIVRISDQTNAGMRVFDFREVGDAELR